MGISADEWNVYPGHFWLRGKQPEKFVEYEEKLQVWNVYGYAEAVEILSKPEIYSNDTKDLDPIKWDEWVNAGDFAQMDPPEHRKVRGLVDYAFTPNLVATLEDRVDGLISELLDKVDGRESFDLMEDFATPLPLIVICDLLGVPPEDRLFFHNAMEEMLSGSGDFPVPEEVIEDTDGLQQSLNLLGRMRDYWRDLVRQRRRTPREDLLSHLIQASINGQHLGDDEIFNIANRLLVAGHSSTSMLISNTVLSFDAFPHQAARVRENRSLMASAVEESLRFLSPISTVGRGTKIDVEVGGQLIPKDQMIMVWLAAANRDERQFPDPHNFDVTRTPNKHLAFSRGVHFCLGRRLGRMEARHAMNTLLDRFPKLRTDPDNPPSFYQFSDATGVDKLPVVVK